MLINFKINRDKLADAGYRLIPNHSYSKRQVDQQWITQAGTIGPNHFPRFHLIRNGNDYNLHFDFFEGHDNEGHKSETESQHILNEANRLKNYVSKHRGQAIKRKQSLARS